uniref:Uncharacterized protein n=1 Tax=Picea glauca TaxID=3330 RepID=A0A101LWA6_PICGL|nr:hypothetical protein ABT39_MTgene1651 [Picea glauca]QHR87932.1 hypothetical protein Q903MT_gene1944 [Picea sitchensis]
MIDYDWLAWALGDPPGVVHISCRTVCCPMGSGSMPSVGPPIPVYVVNQSRTLWASIHKPPP